MPLRPYRGRNNTAGYKNIFWRHPGRSLPPYADLSLSNLRRIDVHTIMFGSRRSVNRNSCLPSFEKFSPSQYFQQAQTICPDAAVGTAFRGRPSMRDLQPNCSPTQKASPRFPRAKTANQLSSCPKPHLEVRPHSDRAKNASHCHPEAIR